MYLDYNQNVK